MTEREREPNGGDGDGGDEGGIDQAKLALILPLVQGLVDAGVVVLTDEVTVLDVAERWTAAFLFIDPTTLLPRVNLQDAILALMQRALIQGPTGELRMSPKEVAEELAVSGGLAYLRLVAAGEGDDAGDTTPKPADAQRLYVLRIEGGTPGMVVIANLGEMRLPAGSYAIELPPPDDAA